MLRLCLWPHPWGPPGSPLPRGNPASRPLCLDLLLQTLGLLSFSRQLTSDLQPWASPRVFSLFSTPHLTARPPKTLRPCTRAPIPDTRPLCCHVPHPSRSLEPTFRTWAALGVQATSWRLLPSCLKPLCNPPPGSHWVPGMAAPTTYPPEGYVLPLETQRLGQEGWDPTDTLMKILAECSYCFITTGGGWGG